MRVGGNERPYHKQEEKTEEGDREFSALGWCFAALCWWEGVIWVVGGEIGNLVPWGVVSPHCVHRWPAGPYFYINRVKNIRLRFLKI